MDNKYYILTNSIKTGPFTLTEISVDQIEADSMIWKSGNKSWVNARELPEFEMYFENVPPPIPSTSNNSHIPKKEWYHNDNLR